MITVIMPLYNDEKYVKDAISALLKQTYKDFELIIVDDCSTDNSSNIVKEFKDKRIKIIRNKKNLGVAGVRNKGISVSKGKYIYFTDSDCVTDKNWLKNGVKTLDNKNCLGVEGKTYYIRKGYKPHISDKMPGSVDAEGQYLGCNMGFKKEVFDIAGLYSTKFGYHEDRDFALRVLKNGKIIKNNDMITTHQQKLWTIKSYLNSSRRAAERILLFKYYDDISLIKFRILFPKNLLKIFFPPLILITLLKQKNKTVLDYKIILVSYWYYIRQRYYIWRTAWKEGVFLL